MKKYKDYFNIKYVSAKALILYTSKTCETNTLLLVYGIRKVIQNL